MRVKYLTIGNFRVKIFDYPEVGGNSAQDSYLEKSKTGEFRENIGLSGIFQYKHWTIGNLLDISHRVHMQKNWEVLRKTVDYREVAGNGIHIQKIQKLGIFSEKHQTIGNFLVKAFEYREVVGNSALQVSYIR